MIKKISLFVVLLVVSLSVTASAAVGAQIIVDGLLVAHIHEDFFENSGFGMLKNRH